MNRPARVGILAVVLALAGSLGLAGQPVAAHEHVMVGEYELILGWREEPAVAGYLNGLDLGILNGTKQPVEGAQLTLNASLSTGPASAAKRLEPQFERPGWYTFDVIPTRPGAYSVRIFGTLGTTAVDVSVTLEDVGPASELSFPDSDPRRDLQSGIDAANAAIAGLQSQVVLALGIAALGLVAGGIGIIAGWRMARSARKAQ